MKKEIRKIENGVLQVTTVDERWYIRETFDEATGLPNGHEFVPSVTWIAGHYPKGIGFYKWLAQKGWDEAEAIKSAAGDKGSKVHQALVDLIDGRPVPMTASYPTPTTGQPEELTLEEYGCLLAFRDWWAVAKPTPITRERTLWHEAHGYAGTMDFFAQLADPAGVWLLDFKTSQDVWPEHELQVSAYKHALLGTPEMAETLGVLDAFGTLRLGILQLGYRRNQRKWKLTEVEDRFDLFLAAQQIWARETEGVSPLQAEYPLEINLTDLPAAPVKITRSRGKTHGQTTAS